LWFGEPRYPRNGWRSRNTKTKASAGVYPRIGHALK
jgi:hypothetical protein